MRTDLPGIARHTAAGGSKRAQDFVTSARLELRKRIPLARFARSCAAPSPKKSRSAKTFPAPPEKTGAGKLLDLHLGAGLFELLLDRGRFVLVDAFLDGLRSAIH